MRPRFMIALMGTLSLSACEYADRAAIVRESHTHRQHCAPGRAEGRGGDDTDCKPRSSPMSSIGQAQLRPSKSSPLLVRSDTMRRALARNVPSEPLLRQTSDLAYDFAIPMPKPALDGLSLLVALDSGTPSSVPDRQVLGPGLPEFERARRSALVLIASPPVIDISDVSLALRGTLG